MNEKIKQLAEQAYVDAGGLVGANEHMSKFAELIVEDVIGSITIVKSNNEVVAVTLTNEDHQIQRVIWQKEHFGVEE